MPGMHQSRAPCKPQGKLPRVYRAQEKEQGGATKPPSSIPETSSQPMVVEEVGAGPSSAMEGVKPEVASLPQRELREEAKKRPEESPPCCGKRGGDLHGDGAGGAWQSVIRWLPRYSWPS